jgi:hypothetical protein
MPQIEELLEAATTRVGLEYVSEFGVYLEPVFESKCPPRITVPG